MTTDDPKLSIHSYEQLEEYLRKWKSFGDPDVYDAAGMVQLFCACIANMRQYMNEAEIEEYGSGLTSNERSFLQAFAFVDPAPDS